MPAVSVKSLQASAAYLTSVVNEHNPSPNCKFLAERVASCINVMLTSNKLAIPPLSPGTRSVRADKESLDSGLIDISNPARDNSNNSEKVNISLLEEKLVNIREIADEITEVEKFFRSYLSSSWTVRTYVTNEQNESRAKELAHEFDKVVDSVLMKLVMDAECVDGQSWAGFFFQGIVSILNFLLPVFILIFIILFVGEKFQLFDNIEEFKLLQQQLNDLLGQVDKDL